MSNISWHLFNVKPAFAIAAALACGMAAAGENESLPSSTAVQDEGSQIWLTSGFRSYHFKRSARYNENNSGVGFEWRFDDERAISGGSYNNSVRRTSNYLHYVWTPVNAGPVKIGGAAGLISGYPELNKGNYGFSLIPVATLNFKVFSHDAGINLVYIPTIAKQVDGSLALQLKIRLK